MLCSAVLAEPDLARWSRSQVPPHVSLRTQPYAIMILVDELAATGQRLAASAATQPRFGIRLAIKIISSRRPNLGEQVVQLYAELPVRKLSCQGR